MSTTQSILLSEKTKLRDAIKAMDAGGIGLVICSDKSGKISGIMTDGDFRRAVLRGVSLDEQVSAVMNRKFYFLKEGYAPEEAVKIFSTTKALRLPVISRDGTKIIEIIKKEDVCMPGGKTTYTRKPLDLPVIIMAGGKGTRLEPFTRILPKALIPIGEKPIIELIIENYLTYGIKKFFISVNHKAKMIKAYFEEHNVENCQIEFIDEDTPLGTAGAISKIKDRIKNTFFVTNCDILVKTDLGQMFSFHKERGNVITLVASLEHHVVPYGVCNLNKDGTLNSINEKPILDFLVNAGVYLCEPEVIDYIPSASNTRFDMTQLISLLLENKKPIGVHPVGSDSWIDVGQWEEYRKALEKIKI